MGDVLAGLARWTGDVVYSFGYPGVAALIALQNLFPPVPSALILPLAGFLVGQGRFSFFPVLLAATTGSVSSALVFYAVGRRIGEERLRKVVGRFGRYALVEESDLDRALGWFGRYGGKAVLFGRLVPGVGTFVSVPAGLARMPMLRFVAYTALGTALWNGAFIGLGWALGSRWQLAQRYLHTFEYGLLAAAVAGGFSGSCGGGGERPERLRALPAALSGFRLAAVRTAPRRGPVVAPGLLVLLTLALPNSCSGLPCAHHGALTSRPSIQATIGRIA